LAAAAVIAYLVALKPARSALSELTMTVSTRATRPFDPEQLLTVEAAAEREHRSVFSHRMRER